MSQTLLKSNRQLQIVKRFKNQLHVLQQDFLCRLQSTNCFGISSKSNTEMLRVNTIPNSDLELLSLNVFDVAT